MQPKTLTRILTLTLVALATTAQLTAQNHTSSKSLVWTGTNRMSSAMQTAPPLQDRGIENQSHDVQYKVVTIPVLPGKTNSFLPDAKSVNNLGHATGYSFVHTDDIGTLFSTGQAFIWRDGKLKALPLLSGWQGAFGFGMNDRDQVVGVANNVDPDGTIHQTAVLWDQGKPINMGSLYPGTNSVALGVNIWGVAVGGSLNPATGFNTPFVWYGGALHALPFLPGMNHGFANQVNDLGMIVGRQLDPRETTEVPALWYWNGSAYSATSLGSFGGDYGEAIGINDLGQAVGWSLSSGDLHGPAFVSDAHGLHALPQLPGDTDGYGSQINELGQIVGYSQLFDDNGDFISQRAVTWQNGAVIELQTVIPPGIPTLIDVGYANNFGMISADSGFLADGTETAYLFVPNH
jgi:uncharacterized membrane protein